MPSYRTPASRTTCCNSLLSMPYCDVQTQWAIGQPIIGSTLARNQHTAPLPTQADTGVPVPAAQVGRELEAAVWQTPFLCLGADNRGSVEPRWARSKVPCLSGYQSPRGSSVTSPYQPRGLQKKTPWCSPWNVMHQLHQTSGYVHRVIRCKAILEKCLCPPFMCCRSNIDVTCLQWFVNGNWSEWFGGWLLWFPRKLNPLDPVM